MNRVLLLTLFTVLISLSAYAEEGKDEQPQTPKFNAEVVGISFAIPEGVTVEGDIIPVKFNLDGAEVVGDFKIVPGDFNSLKALVQAEMEKKGYVYKSVLSEISKGCQLSRFLFAADKKECQLLVYPAAQAGHRFFFFSVEGEEIDPIVNKYLETLFLTVEIKDVLKENPPKPIDVNDEKHGMTFSAPWYWRMKSTKGDLKYSYDVFFVNGYYNHVSISVFMDKGITLEEAVKLARDEMSRQTNYAEVGNTPHKIGELDGSELEYTWTIKDTKVELRERRLLVVRNKDLFDIRFTTNMLGYRAGLDDYLAFMKTIKIDPRKEDLLDDPENDNPEREPKVE